MFPVRQKRRQGGTRGILAAVAVAWLTLALQPCAMAFQGEQIPGCPHCPPSQQQAHDAHDMAADGMPCVNSAIDCGDSGDLNNNERTDQIKLKDLPKDLPAGLAPAAALIRVERAPASTANLLAVHRPHGNSPPLHKIFCVYLK